MLFQNIWQRLRRAGGAALVGYKGTTLETFLNRAATRFSWASASDLPRFMKTIRSYRNDLHLPTNVVYFGNSVDNGASLDDPVNDAPGAYFVRMLKKLFDPGNLYNIRGHNFSVDGSTVSEFPAAWARMVAAGITPHLVIIGYNMNDQAPAIFNSGQTFPGYQAALRDAIFIANRAGCDVVKLNGPHPAVVTHPELHAMPPSIDMNYPTKKVKPVLPEQMDPPASQSVVRADFLGEGVQISLGYRMLRIQQAARDVCREYGALLIDGEPYYMEALQEAQVRLGTPELAEAEFFKPGESVHPNLKGHMASYWPAIDAFMYSFARQGGQSNVAPQMNGYIWMNRRAGPGGAGLEVNTPYPDRETVPFAVLARVGVPDANNIPAELPILAIDPANGDLVLGNGIQRFASNLVNGGVAADGASRAMRPYGANFKERICGDYNNSTSWTMTGFPDNAMGELSIMGENTGIGTSPQMKKYYWKTKAGVLQIGANGADPWGSLTFNVAVGAGLTLVVTPVAANTNFQAYWWSLSA